MNHHCSVVEIDGSGVLIEGPSGAGKTSLALALLERASQQGLDAALVCDDQALLCARNTALYAATPASIAGKAELRGYGIIALTHKPETRVRLVVRMIEDARIDRMPEPATATLAGIELPRLDVPQRHESQSVRIVFAWLGEGVLKTGV